MNRFSKIQLLPSSWILTSIHDCYCQYPAASSCEEFPGSFYFSSLMSTLSCEYYFLCETRTLNPSKSPRLFTLLEEGKTPPPHPTILSPGRSKKNSLGPSKLAITNPAPQSLSLCLLFWNKPNFCRSKLWQQICHMPKWPEWGNPSKATEYKNELCVNKSFTYKLLSSRFSLFPEIICFFPKTKEDIKSHCLSDSLQSFWYC